MSYNSLHDQEPITKADEKIFDEVDLSDTKVGYFVLQQVRVFLKTNILQGVESSKERKSSLHQSR